MAKNPYIQFYIGDHLKDTRILPLNVRGGWVDLLLYMWENEPKGELTGTTEDFARLMSCSPQEAILVIQTLKEKKIFAWEELQNGQLRIMSRKQKRMVNLSEIRKKSGKNGGNPNLLSKQPTKSSILVNQKHNQNTENENKEGLGNEERGAGEEEEGRGGFSGGDPPVWKEGDWDHMPEGGSQLPGRMVEIFVAAFPGYPIQQEKDFAACLQIAYQIVDQNGWTWQSALNGHLQDVLAKWQEIVTWARGDPWYKSKPISFWNTNFQGLIQAKNNGKTYQTNLGNPQPPAGNGHDPTLIASTGFGKL